MGTQKALELFLDTKQSIKCLLQRNMRKCCHWYQNHNYSGVSDCETVAGVISIASVMVPTLKMIAIAWLCWDAKGHDKPLHLIYGVVEFRCWSTIDVFVIAAVSVLVWVGGLMSIYPAMGALLFALVVIITMFAAMAFDPRLLWDLKPGSSH